MADQDIKDFTIGWVLFGLIIFSLSVFVLSFTFNNNPNALSQTEGQLELLRNNFNSSLTGMEGSYDVQTNVSAELNSEESSLGTASASSTSYTFLGTGKSMWINTKVFISWIFAGDFGKFILLVFGGMIAVRGLFYIIKMIRGLL